ncbi:MAG: DNA polymerase III subunit beta [Rikenellaceae bacterium]
MKFTISSSTLLSTLSTAGKVISTKNTFPILDYFLLELNDSSLKITTSDLETTLISSIKIDNIEQLGAVAAPAKLMLDSLKEFSDIPLTIEVNSSTWEITISWKSGSLSIPGANPSSYPSLQSLGEEQKSLSFTAEALFSGINRTIFATADDDLRPMMNGIYINIAPEGVTFVATDAHKLVKITDHTTSDITASFILPKRPANLLKNLLVKADCDIEVSFDSKNVMLSFNDNIIVCRLIEGSYPNYNAVIPSANPNKVIIDRVELINSIRRVAVCSNPTTNLIRMEISENCISLKAQDIDFSVSANETLSCSYTAQDMTIGFKSTFLVELLNNIETQNVLLELADSTRAGVFKPLYEDNEAKSDVLMLLMPMMINA